MKINKLLLLLFLIPNMVMGKTCFINEGKYTIKHFQNLHDALQACNNGEQLHYSITKFGRERDVEDKASLIGKRATYCDLRYEAYIEQVSSTSTLTCIFKNHLKE